MSGNGPKNNEPKYRRPNFGFTPYSLCRSARREPVSGDSLGPALCIFMLDTFAGGVNAEYQLLKREVLSNLEDRAKMSGNRCVLKHQMSRNG